MAEPSARTVESSDALGRAAEELSALAREGAPSTERERRLPEVLVGGLRASGLFRAGAPSGVGGAEAPPAVMLRCAEEVARGDGSAGWCVSIAATSSLLGGWLSGEGLAEVFGNRQNVAAGVWAPRGAARRVDGGYRVSGRWGFCSGIMHSDYLFGGCMVQDGSDGSPTPRVLGMAVSELEVVDSWHTSGLRGTGSHDAVADDVFVPEHRSLWLLDPPTSPTPLYRFPIFSFFALSISAAALGIARGAIDDLKELAVDKVGLGSSRTLGQRPATWAAVAAAEASLRAARGVLLPGDRRGMGGGAFHPAGVGRAARRPAAGGHARREDGGGCRPQHVRPGGRIGHL